ncbi:hypothetical protein VroAM7_38400 [Vibrio rotiferianus]|jgi:hypothetical protein|uniref:Uncharacterized protein n=1 Tax=Vibrio rotiferianus TaxID=190895 RepID=A0A510ICC8_9VIBR|nr:hypothetical protein VroAM7_38400 [Vibrio rotiferianus]
MFASVGAGGVLSLQPANTATTAVAIAIDFIFMDYFPVQLSLLGGIVNRGLKFTSGEIEPSVISRLKNVVLL